MRKTGVSYRGTPRAGFARLPALRSEAPLACLSAAAKKKEENNVTASPLRQAGTAGAVN
jgi:hypothetical protein